MIMAKESENKSEIIFYQTEDGHTRLEVQLVNESVWLSLNQMTELFQRDKSVISKHIKNVFEEGELRADSVVANFATTAADGKTYQVAHYNLDVIISVGYRVKSLSGTQFRIWATQRLREYIVKGFTLDDERLKQGWEDAIYLWLGGRKNLRAFFVENHPTARKWIDEMLEARLILDKNPDWTLDDVAQISHLRPEYFDEVPETAIFLRPIETETLFRDRPRLRLRWQPGVVALQLETPRLKDEDLLPSDWHILAQRVAASTNPVSIPLHRGAFTQDLALKLVRVQDELAAYQLRGVWPWGLWSESGGAFISLQARELPMDDYVLVSRSPLDFTNRDGWLGDDEDETRWNQEAQMPDGLTCFVSRLVPDARRAALEVVGWHRITFAPRARLELRVFPRVTERFFLTFTPPKSVALPTWPRFVVKPGKKSGLHLT